MEKWFLVDNLGCIMLTLIGFISTNIALYAWRYLSGDRCFRKFYLLLILLSASLATLVIADNLLLFAATWMSSNILLVMMMIHKSEWAAAKASGLSALLNFSIGSFFLSTGFIMIYLQTGLTSIHEIIITGASHNLQIPLSLLAIAALSQSALFPFNKWLLSSLNSPTPVSALMHAGLVNGGGFLLVRFAPLYLAHDNILTIIFAVGLFSAILGTTFKLLQNDVKRMLASSTMAQMGFMIAQCGMGLFPAAIAHLCWHGLFKAYLFLNSGSAAQERRNLSPSRPNFISFILALGCGVTGMISFAYMSNKSIIPQDTTLLLNLVALVAGTQLSLTLLQYASLRSTISSFLITTAAGSLYGLSVYLITGFLPDSLSSPLELNPFHITACVTVVSLWLGNLYLKASSDLWKKMYVFFLNGSQPSPQTITAHRKSYKF